MTEVVAQREVLVEKPSGEMFATAIQFSKPYQSEKHGWCCDLNMKGIDKSRFGAGVDSLQAIMLTMSLAESILVAREKDGWKIYWPDTKDLMTAKNMFDVDSFVGNRE